MGEGDIKLREGFTRGPDLTLRDLGAGLEDGDVFYTRSGRNERGDRWIGWPGRIVKVNRTTFAWHDGRTVGLDETTWVRRTPIHRLQGAAIFRGGVIHVLSDPSLPALVAEPPAPDPVFCLGTY